MSAFQKGWYLIYTKPRHEKKLHGYLEGKSIASFLPLKKEVRVRHNRKKVIDDPLFPSYVFVYLNDIGEYYTGADAAGSLYYVRDGKEAVRVSETIIRNIRIVADHADDIEVSNIRFRPGQGTIIRGGPLMGLACEIVEANNRQKLLVRVDLLQRSLLLAIATDSVVPYVQPYTY